MSFLTPLYALAALAVAVPILLHLVRREPKNRLEFSSLLFLPESPPRLTRNSRIEHWLLLLLRSLVLLMIAFAFARPYWNQTVDTPSGSAAGKRKC
ncbi:MAG: BatA domain-containing protein, partial [Planctomycetota bacterium]